MILKKRDIDMVSGTLFGKMIVFALPIMVMNFLQLLFNAADMIIVGHFANKEALAAVGAAGPLINLLVNLFMGLSVGTSVIVSKDYGGHKYNEVSQSVHTSMAISIIAGVVVMVLGFVFCKPLLSMMGTPEDIIDLSSLYMLIYFAGIPATMVFNFGAAILRAVGDSQRPLYYLTIAGISNIFLNLIFVILLKMSVAGVALATAISQYLSMVLIIICLIRSHGAIGFIPKEMRIYKDKLKTILKVGLPAGIQGLLFSVSNAVVQSAVNSFGTVMVAANSAAGNVEGFVGTTMNAYYNTAITFTGQNMGAKKYDRIDRIAKISTALIFVTWIILGGIILLFGRSLLGIYTPDSEIIDFGMQRMQIMMAVYFICGVMLVFPGLTRAMGYSILPMLSTLIGACVLRIVWLATIFARTPTIFTLYVCYPITWAIAGIGQVGIFFYARWQIRRKGGADTEPKISMGSV
ncbi:MAG: MATE family efflux transporter [Clostridiales bacterium]|nr:MATE family efflux transporter [Clostridiales bacterium]